MKKKGVELHAQRNSDNAMDSFVCWDYQTAEILVDFFFSFSYLFIWNLRALETVLVHRVRRVGSRIQMMMFVALNSSAAPTIW